MKIYLSEKLTVYLTCQIDSSEGKVSYGRYGTEGAGLLPGYTGRLCGVPGDPGRIGGQRPECPVCVCEPAVLPGGGVAQMPFGEPTADPKPIEKLPVQERVWVRK